MTVDREMTGLVYGVESFLFQRAVAKVQARR